MRYHWAMKAETIDLYPDETLEDLQRAGLRLIQKRDGFRFGEDALFLVHEAAAGWDSGRRGPLRFVEFGAGSGVCSILLTVLSPGSRGIGVEVVSRQAEVMERNIRLNGLESRLAACRADIRDIADPGRDLPERLEPAAANLVLMNPPYLPAQDRAAPGEDVSRPEISLEKRMAREEVAVNLPAICRAASRLLRHRGKLICIQRAARMFELYEAMGSAGLSPGSLRLIQANADSDAYACIMTGTKGGKSGGFKILSTLVVRDNEGQYTGQVGAIYGSPSPLSQAELYEGISMRTAYPQNIEGNSP